MLRIGLTGDLGSGKSTVAHLLAERGAIVFSSDDMGRAMMQPGDAIHADIVAHFGNDVLLPSGELDRKKLARLAFDDGRVEELNAIVHPAVIAAQAEQIAVIERGDPHAIVVIESALLFTTRHAGDGLWSKRFDHVLLVTAPEDVKIKRFIERASQGKNITPAERTALEADARRRLSTQIENQQHAAECIVIANDGDLAALEQTVDAVWARLVAQKIN